MPYSHGRQFRDSFGYQNHTSHGPIAMCLLARFVDDLQAIVLLKCVPPLIRSPLKQADATLEAKRRTSLTVSRCLATSHL